MFERYSESARRALFFARYEVSALGHLSIAPEHLLIGLLRTDGVAARLLADSGVTLDAVRADLQQHAGTAAEIATSLEIPFSGALKGVLETSALEADSLHHT